MAARQIRGGAWLATTVNSHENTKTRVTTKTRRHEEDNHEETRRKNKDSQDNSFQAVLQNWHVEVDQQPDRKLRDSEITEKLRLMDGVQVIDRLDLQNQLTVHHDVEFLIA